MEKITKKKFREIIETNQSAFLGSSFVNGNKLEFLKGKLLKFDTSKLTEFRTVKLSLSNSIAFSNDSWLYFNDCGKHKYYQEGNFLIYEVEYGEDSKFNYIVYYIKDKE